MAANTRCGFHSGTLHCRDAKVLRDLYVQDDIIFSDVSAGTLGITGGIDMQLTTSAIGIDMGGTFTTAALNIDGTLTGGRAIRIGTKTSESTSLKICSGLAVDAEPANNYLFGLFSKVSASEATATDELRGAWIRTRVNDACHVGSNAGWGYGVCGAEIQLKVYADTAATDMYSWQNSAVWAQLETQGAGGVNFKSGSYSQCVLANVGLTATTTIDALANVAGVTINSNTAAAVTATGGFYGLYITQKTAGLLDFQSGIYINADSCTTGMTIGACTTGISISGATTTAISLSGDATTGISITSGMSPTNAILINATADTGINITGDIVTGINLTSGSSTAITAASPINVTLSGPTSAKNGIYSLVNASAGWSSGNVVAVRGKVIVTGTDLKVSKTAVWAGVVLSSVYTETGLTCAVNAEISSTTAQCPNSIVYIQSLPGTGANFANVPYLVFSETAVGTGSNILFEVGHNAAGTTPTLTSGTLFYEDTLQIAVNKAAGVRTPYYIPLSTAQGTFTTAYPIVSTASATAISIGTATTGIAMTGNYTNGILFTGQPVLTAANRNASYFGIGSFGSHVILDRSAQHNSNRSYLMQLFVDSQVDTPITFDEIRAFSARIDITTANQTKTQVSGLTTQSTISYNVKAASAIKAELDVSGANCTAIGDRLYTISSLLDLGDEAKNFDVSGSIGCAAGIFDIDGGANLTLVGSSRTYALIANVYDSANVTGVLCLHTAGTLVKGFIDCSCLSPAVVPAIIHGNYGSTFFIDADTSGNMGFTNGVMTHADPAVDAPDGHARIQVGGQTFEIPYYAIV